MTHHPASARQLTGRPQALLSHLKTGALQLRRLLASALLPLSPAAGQRAPAAEPSLAESSGSPPGPARARAAADRVRPALDRDLAAKGLRLGDPVFLRAFKEEDQLELWVLKRNTRIVNTPSAVPNGTA